MSIISHIRTIALSAVAVASLSSCVEEQFKGHDNPDGKNPSVKIVNTPVNAEEGELLVCLSTDAVESLSKGRTVASLTPEGIDVTDFRPVFNITEGNREFARKHTLDRWYKISFDGIAIDQAAAKIAQMSEVSRVQYNKTVTYGPHTMTTSRSAATKSGSQEVKDPQNPLLQDQWNLINTGDKKISASAIEGADIAIKDVWEKLGVYGSKDIIVAIIDGPVKYTHEDLLGNMWVNEAELKGSDGVDDDGNGYEDDIYGWNCERDTCKIEWSLKSETGHGTHVAGIIGAINNNGKGICGVAGGNDPEGNGARLMSCQIFAGGSSSNTASAAIAFVYAADNGAHIAQCSFGYQNSTYDSDYEYYQNYQMEYHAIQYFLDKKRFQKKEAELIEKGRATKSCIDGPLVIFASGNEGVSRSSYPGALMDCICVTGIGPDGMPASYTNFGPGCNIAAPGGDYYLSNSGKSEILSTFISELSDNADDYTYMQGTSMACPHVSGVAALGLEYAKSLGKQFTREEFVSRLLTSVNDIDSRLNTGYKYLGTDALTGGELPPRPYSSYQYKMGTGTIDAWRFMMSIEGTPCLTVKAGEHGSYDLSDFFGGGAEYLTYTKVNISSTDKKALGITDDKYCKIENGRLSLYPTKNGSGKIRITAIAGGNVVAGNREEPWTSKDMVTVPNDNDKMGGMEITREISILSRGVASKNGGWL